MREPTPPELYSAPPASRTLGVPLPQQNKLDRASRMSSTHRLSPRHDTNMALFARSWHAAGFFCLHGAADNGFHTPGSGSRTQLFSIPVAAPAILPPPVSGRQAAQAIPMGRFFRWPAGSGSWAVNGSSLISHLLSLILHHSLALLPPVQAANSSATSLAMAAHCHNRCG